MDALIADSRYGIVGAERLLAVGESRRAIDYRLEVGRLHRLYRNSYAIGHEDVPLFGLYRAACTSLGELAVLTDRSAGILWDCIKEEDEEERRDVHVSLPSKRRGQPGLRPHLRMLHPRDVTMRYGIPVTTPARTLLDLAAILPKRQLRRALRQAEVDRRVSHAQLRELLHRCPGVRGAAKLRSLVEEGPAPTRSVLEDKALEVFELAGLPKPLINRRVEGWEVDFHWPEQRLIIECDGARWHDTPTARALDAEKQRALQAAGWTVIRLRWAAVTLQRAATLAFLRRLER